jgi:hypothetical protein
MTAEVYKWRYGFGRTERLNFIKRVTPDPHFKRAISINPPFFPHHHSHSHTLLPPYSQRKNWLTPSGGFPPFKIPIKSLL